MIRFIFLVCGKTLNLLWQFNFASGQIFILVNGKNWKNLLEIWSHWWWRWMISKDPSFIEISADQIARFDLVVYWTINWIDQNVCWPENVPLDETTHSANKLFVNPLDVHLVLHWLKVQLRGSGCGSVGKAVSRGPRFIYSHSSVVLSTPTILLPRVQIPSTTSTLFSICIIEIVSRKIWK